MQTSRARSRDYAHYHRIYKVLQEIYENNRICNWFISLKISDSSPRDSNWDSVGVGPLGTGHRDLVKELETRFQELRENSVNGSKKCDKIVKQSSVESQRPVGGEQTDAQEKVSDVKNRGIDMALNFAVFK